MRRIASAEGAIVLHFWPCIHRSPFCQKVTGPDSSTYMNTMPLPPEFFLYIPTRSPYNSLVRVLSEEGTGGYTLQTPAAAGLQFNLQFTQLKPESLPLGTFTLKGLSCSTAKRFSSVPSIRVKNAAGIVYPVLRIADPKKHVPSIERNFLVGKFEVPCSAPAPAPAPITDISGNIISNNYIDMSGNLFPNNHMNVSTPPPSSAPIPPVPPPIKRKKLVAPTKPAGDLSVHVARKLMELAILKKDMCPITVEEFSAGNTAVMPCGHLFMQMAIEESFKKEHRKCPECRQIGSPTYV